jgi:hypothetical protein
MPARRFEDRYTVGGPGTREGGPPRPVPGPQYAGETRGPQHPVLPPLHAMRASSPPGPVHQVYSGTHVHEHPAHGATDGTPVYGPAITSTSTRTAVTTPMIITLRTMRRARRCRVRPWPS